MSRRAFFKYEGLGNDFVLLEARAEAEIPEAREVTALCDRRRGIGADGVLVVLPASGASAARMRVINADGSVPEMCGNGLRCVAFHIARSRGVQSDAESVRIDTDAGPRACVVDIAGAYAMVDADMGTVRALGPRELDIGGARVVVHLADAGNPHAVVLRSPDACELAQLGPAIATHPAFPRGTNVEFAEIRDGIVDVAVWERGVGATLACATGACAVVATMCKLHMIPEANREARATVRLPGGTLNVTYRADTERARSRGPARHVYSGELFVMPECETDERK